MVGMDIRDDMVPSVHAQLTHIIELTRFSRFHTDARIGIRGTVMGLVTGVFTTLVARALTLVLILCPLLVTALYRSKILLVGTDSLLFFTGLVLFALSKRLLCV